MVLLFDQLEEDRGITPNNNLVTEGDTTFVTISVQARAENDNTTLEYVAISPDLMGARSDGVLLQVQGIVFTHVLIPILSETGVSVVLESGLEEDTHFTATLSFNSQQITTTTFCESHPARV